MCIPEGKRRELNSLLSELKKHKKLILVAPTGWGKTLYTSLFLREKLGVPIIVRTPSRMAGKKARDSLNRICGEKVGVYLGGDVDWRGTRIESGKIYFVTDGVLLSLLGVLRGREYALLVDEVHQETPHLSYFLSLLAVGRVKPPYIIFMTATLPPFLEKYLREKIGCVEVYVGEDIVGTHLPPSFRVRVRSYRNLEEIAEYIVEAWKYIISQGAKPKLLVLMLTRREVEALTKILKFMDWGASKKPEKIVGLHGGVITDSVPDADIYVSTIVLESSVNIEGLNGVLISVAGQLESRAGPVTVISLLDRTRGQIIQGLSRACRGEKLRECRKGGYYLAVLLPSGLDVAVDSELTVGDLLGESVSVREYKPPIIYPLELALNHLYLFSVVTPEELAEVHQNTTAGVHSRMFGVREEQELAVSFWGETLEEAYRNILESLMKLEYVEKIVSLKGEIYRLKREKLRDILEVMRSGNPDFLVRLLLLLGKRGVGELKKSIFGCSGLSIGCDLATYLYIFSILRYRSTSKYFRYDSLDSLLKAVYKYVFPRLGEGKGVLVVNTAPVNVLPPVLFLVDFFVWLKTRKEIGKGAWELLKKLSIQKLINIYNGGGEELLQLRSIRTEAVNLLSSLCGEHIQGMSGEVFLERCGWCIERVKEVKNRLTRLMYRHLNRGEAEVLLGLGWSMLHPSGRKNFVERNLSTFSKLGVFTRVHSTTFYSHLFSFSSP